MNTINIKGNLLNLESPIVMGILNLTPDSFYSNSRINNVNQLVEQAGLMLEQGATILDLGAYSTRPGALEVSEKEEIERIVPAVKAIISAFPNAIISVDTFRAEVANITVNEGASIINDVSGGNLDNNLLKTVAKLKVPYVLMHMRGTPQNMALLTNYEDIISDMLQYFNEKIDYLNSLGVYDIMLDPGFGFAKTTDQNFEVLRSLEAFNCLNLPVLVGFSRKSMITKTLNISAHEALNGTTALNMVALKKNAKILRVHDVLEAKQCIDLYKKLI